MNKAVRATITMFWGVSSIFNYVLEFFDDNDSKVGATSKFSGFECAEALVRLELGTDVECKKSDAEVGIWEYTLAVEGV